jgi:hypothetical protein
MSKPGRQSRHDAGSAKEHAVPPPLPTESVDFALWNALMEDPVGDVEPAGGTFEAIAQRLRAAGTATSRL